MRSFAFCAPLRSCKRTGVVGGTNVKPLTVNVPELVCMAISKRRRPD